jgi:parallel beta-helix repeat protein
MKCFSYFRVLTLLLIGIFALGLCACGEPEQEPVEQPPEEKPSEPDPEPLPDPIEIWVMSEPYGAKGDGVTNDRAAIQKAIDDANAAPGGGIVHLNAGKTFLTGNLLLRSNVELHFEDGAEILQSSNPMDFVDPLDGFKVKELVFGQYVNPEIEWDAAAYYNYPLIYATEGTQNIKITGKGLIEMSAGEDPRGIMTMQAIGLYEVDGYELSDFTVRKYFAYCIAAVSCRNGLYENLTIDITGGILGGTDGINMCGCQNIRVTGCRVNSGDDGIYMGSSYGDPRAGLWFRLENLRPIQNIEIDHNHAEVAWDATKAFCFIMWGSRYPDPSAVEVSNIYVHDNYFETAGAWLGSWNLETHKFEFDGSCNPMKNIRFENNTIDRFEDSFYALQISDVYGFDCMIEMRNGDFAKKDIYWVSRAGGKAGERDGYGYIEELDKADAALYEGIKLREGMEYEFKAKVMSSGDKARLFVKDQITGELIASKEFTNTDWKEVSFSFEVPKTGNYHVGVERGEAKSGWARIDDVSVAPAPFEDIDLGGVTIFDSAVFEGAKQSQAGGFRNQYSTIFTPKVNGDVVGVRIYTGPQECGIHYVSIWNQDTGKMLTSEFYEWDIEPGYTAWRTFELPEYVSLKAGTRYAVVVSAGPDMYFWVSEKIAPIDNEYFKVSGHTCGSCLDAVNGFWHLPGYYTSDFAYRDIVFIPD